MAMTKVQFEKAFREAASLEYIDVPCEEKISFSFSDKFENKMINLIAQQKKIYWEYVCTTKKRVAIAVVAVFLSCIVALGNAEVSASMLQWCEEVYEEYIRYYFDGNTKKEIEHEYQLTMVPEGFEVVQMTGDSALRIIQYRSNVGDCIKLAQGITEDMEYYWDSENGKWNMEILDDKEVKLFDYTSVMGAIWVEDGYFMSLIYYGCEDIEVIKTMVETIE